MIGQTLAHYEILAKLGEGGMSKVYRALDRKLDREVALKILPAALADDQRFIERFEREAKTVAALNHPNIVTLHSVEDVGGVRFLTMELVEGTGLDKNIPKDGLALDRFFELALPLTEAVAAAHEAGVTHRDLKPANVMVASKGRLKVLDFGLAKLLEPSGDTLVADAQTEALTREGLVVGTVPYMSPEQAQGDAVDSRSDIFSLGIMLYEMLTGSRPFAGRNSAEVISALLRDTPAPVDAISTGLPSHLVRIVRRCLEKDPDRRYQSARDLVIELEDLQREAVGAQAGASGLEQRSDRWLKALRGAGLVLLVIVLAALIKEWATNRSAREDPAERTTPVRLTKITGGAGLEDEPAWSPDGGFLAYTTDARGNLDIVVQPLGGGELIRAFASDADEVAPTWSPDGRRMAFISSRDRGGRLSPGVGLGTLTAYVIARGGDLFVGPALGGPALKLAEDAYMPSWSPDGERIAFVSPGEHGLAIWTVRAEGGRPEQISSGRSAFDPAWSPDGLRICYAYNDSLSGAFQLHVAPAGGGPPVVLEMPVATQVMGPAWSSDGELIYFTSNLGGRFNLWRVQAPSAKAGGAFGQPSQVTFGVGADVNVSVAAGTGKLAFSTISTDVNLWELTVASGTVRQVTTETGIEINAQESPDGGTLLISTDRGGQPEVWSYSAAGEPLRRVGRAVSVDFTGIWSPDGSRIAYSRGDDDGLVGVAVKKLGSLDEELLLADAFAGEWSPDGDEILAARIRAEDPRYTDVVSIGIDNGDVRQLSFFDSSNQFMTWSPDGSQVIFNSELGGSRKLWRVPAVGGDPEQLTFGDSEDSHPRWSRTNPNAVLFLRNHSTICVLDPATGQITELEVDVGSHFGLDYPSWSADGAKVYFSVASKSGDIFVTEE